MVERRPVKAMVLGSSPSSGALMLTFKCRVKAMVLESRFPHFGLADPPPADESYPRSFVAKRLLGQMIQSLNLGI